MPHDRFHVMDGARIEQDTVGAELAGPSDAYAHALAKAREIMQPACHHRSWAGCVIGVEDAPGRLAMLVPFPPNVRVAGRPGSRVSTRQRS